MTPPQLNLDAAALALLRELADPERSNPPLLAVALEASATETLLDCFDAAAGATRKENAAPSNWRTKRFAGVVLGSVGEQEFEAAYRTLAGEAPEFILSDQTKEGTDTDFLTRDAQGRPAFRINVKTYGARFDKARQFVGLDPEDTFGVATYKVRAAYRKSQREALPYLFAIVSRGELRADVVATNLPPHVVYLMEASTLYTGLTGWKTIEDRLIERLLDPSGASSEAVKPLREAIRASEYRIISAIKANHLLNERLDERVPAISNPEFRIAPNSQPNMHFSLEKDMIGLGELLERLRVHGIQHVATQIAYREL